MNDDILTNVNADPTTCDKISVTELKTLLRCTQKHAYSYRQGLQSAEPPSFLGKGRYLHMLQEYWLQSHVEGDPITDVAVLSNKVQQEMARLREEENDLAAVVLEPDRVQVDGLMAHYMSETDMTDVEILGIEQQVYVDLGWRNAEGNPVLLHGVIDALIRTPDGLWVLEHKTAGRAWSQGQFAWDYQPRLYTDAVEALGYERPLGTMYQFFLPKRTDSAAVYVTPEESQHLRDEVQRAIDLRDAGIIVRQPHWGCNDCWFKHLCHAEMINGEADYIRETQFVVNEDKVARFQEV